MGYLTANTLLQVAASQANKGSAEGLIYSCLNLE
jgi:hypothetical protein